MSFLVFYLFALLYILAVGKSLWRIPNRTEHPEAEIPEETGRKLSLIVPFRNEIQSLPHLLAQIETLLPQSQLTEVILVDDHSSDEGTALVKDFAQSYPEKVSYQLSEGKASKKRAIHTGIKTAEADWILISDADSEFPRAWLSSMLSKPELDLLVGPVLFYSRSKSFLGSFQVLDSLALLGVGQSSSANGTPLFASASNMLFRREHYLKLDPFSSNWDLASGDDVFLLQSFVKAGLKVDTTWSSKALVQSAAPETLKAMLKQKIRWASKNPSVASLQYQFVAFAVLLFNLCLVISLVMSLLGVIPKIILVIWGIKLVIDYPILHRISNLYSKNWSMLDFSLSFLLYPFYVTFIGFLSFFYKPKWK